MTEPVAIGSRFVLATLDEHAGDQVKLHVSVAVGPEEELPASELSVTAVAGGNQLEMSEGPKEGALPTVSSRGTTAFGQYTFANPGAATPVVVTVGIGGESAEFELADGPPVA